MIVFEPAGEAVMHKDIGAVVWAVAMLAATNVGFDPASRRETRTTAE